MSIFPINGNKFCYRDLHYQYNDPINSNKFCYRGLHNQYNDPVNSNKFCYRGLHYQYNDPVNSNKFCYLNLHYQYDGLINSNKFGTTILRASIINKLLGIRVHKSARTLRWLEFEGEGHPNLKTQDFDPYKFI